LKRNKFRRKNIKKRKEDKSVLYEKKLRKRKFRLSFLVYVIFVFFLMMWWTWKFVDNWTFSSTQYAWYMTNSDWDVLITKFWQINLLIEDVDLDGVYDAFRYDLNGDAKANYSYVLDNEWRKWQVHTDKIQKENIFLIMFLFVLVSILLMIWNKGSKKNKNAKVKLIKWKKNNIIVSFVVLVLCYSIFGQPYVLAQSTWVLDSNYVQDKFWTYADWVLSLIDNNSSLDSVVYVVESKNSIFDNLADIMFDYNDSLYDKDILDEVIDESNESIEVVSEVSSDLDEVIKFIGPIWDIIGVFNDYNEYSDVFSWDKAQIKEATSISFALSTVLCANPISLVIDFFALSFFAFGEEEISNNIFNFSIDRIMKETLFYTYDIDWKIMRKNNFSFMKEHWIRANNQSQFWDRVREWYIALMVTVSWFWIIFVKRCIDHMKWFVDWMRNSFIGYIALFVDWTKWFFECLSYNSWL